MSNLVYRVRGIDPAHNQEYVVYVLAFSPNNAKWVALGLLKSAGWRGGYMESDYFCTLDEVKRNV